MSELYAAVLGATIGAVLGGGASFLGQARATTTAARTERTLRLYEEWQSDSMLTARITAHEVLTRNRSAVNPRSFTALYSDLQDSGRPDDWHAVSRIVHFFELAGKLSQEAALDRRTFWSLLGRYVDYWRERTLDDFMALSERHDDPAESGWTTAVRSLTPP